MLFGAAALARADQATADRTMDLILEHGVNHIDVARGYGDAERLLGPWMETHRDRFFLASKTPSRDYATALSDIRDSLAHLRTDQLDLIQLHSLIHPDEWEQALGPGGALEAAQEARALGLVRFIGVTGHNWTIAAQHYRALQRFDFDSVLLPWNWFMHGSQRYAADFERTLALCRERRVAVQTIKSLARGAWAAGGRRSALDLVPAAGGPGRHPPGGALDPGAPGGRVGAVPQLHRRREPAADPAGGGGRGRSESQRRRDARHGQPRGHDFHLRHLKPGGLRGVRRPPRCAASAGPAPCRTRSAAWRPAA